MLSAAMSGIAADVVAILHEYFGSSGSASNASDNAKRLAEKIKEILLDSEFIEATTKEYIEYDDDPTDPDYLPLKDSSFSEDEEEPDSKKIRFSDVWVPKECVEDAIAFYRSSSKQISRPFSTMKSRYRWIKDRNHMQRLREIEKNGIDAANRQAALLDLKRELISWVSQKLAAGVSLHDCNLREQAIRMSRKNPSICNFKCSHSWIQKFKRENRLCSRRITKFVSRKTFKNMEKIKDDSKKFVAEIKDLIKTEKLPLTAVFNADQSGFVKEMHTTRTLAVCGQKHVFCLVDSVSATTHSFTVMPLIGAGGNVYKKLYIVLQEPGGKAPNTPPFATDNLIVDYNTTHIMTKKLMVSWVQRCVVPDMPKKMLLLVDSWSSFKDHQEIQRHIPKGKKILIRNIPPGATGLIQPCDVGLFLHMKRFMKKITSFVQVHEISFPVSKRNNILKVISQVWRIFCHPRFSNMFAYAFHKSGYVDSPPPFDNPVDISFPKTMLPSCEEAGCSNYPFIFCVYCDRHICFDHYLISFHKC